MADNFLLKVTEKHEGRQGTRNVYREAETFEDAIEALNDEIGISKVIKADLEYPIEFGPDGPEVLVDQIYKSH